MTYLYRNEKTNEERSFEFPVGKAPIVFDSWRRVFALAINVPSHFHESKNIYNKPIAGKKTLF